jgi:hypothetical protein
VKFERANGAVTGFVYGSGSEVFARGIRRK